ncbi:hypothetical protein K435DRAFT_963262 [Dendrothele bispora CBS 962.96]|uniref:Zn(2)-C6 fungal-type domain-containing protein n=1 Tax=Dendrothele bispora (strain CBS 962.96) TaxID=1314807 RepID=A0A4V4HHE0_DENBC|nr:hypothetical protein K435DRAFT_963262 [Dendrothele bispora CBS 962.96]
MAHPPVAFARRKACENCRRRKTKCDGVRPSCGSCMSNPQKFGDCEYADGPLTRNQQLLNMIDLLKTRLETHGIDTDLSDPSLSSSFESLTIHTPVNPSPQSPHYPDFIGDPGPSPRYRIPDEGIGYYPDPTTTYDPEDRVITFTPTMYDSFLKHSIDLGFFLAPSHLRALLWPENHISNRDIVHPALRSTMHLWSNVIQDPMMDHHEHILLPQVLQTASFRNFGAEKSPHRTHVLHVVQAEVLLARYFLYKGNIFEGKYRIAGVLSLVFDMGWHKNTTPQTSLEGQEQNHAFWTVLNLNNMWSTAAGGPFLDFQSPAAQVDTPWPSINCIRSGNHQGQTIMRFLTETTDAISLGSVCVLTCLTKAGILWQEATKLAFECSNPASTMPGYFDLFSSRFQVLDTIIRQFTKLASTIPDMFFNLYPKSYILARTLGHLAIVVLHRPFVTQSSISCETTLVALRSIAHSLAMIDLKEWQIFDPISGILWLDILKTVAFQIRNCSNTPEVERELLHLFESLSNIMQELSKYSMFIKFQAAHIDQLR